jgi:hypothetical protein
LMLKIFNLNGTILQIRSKQRATSASTKLQGMSFELSEFQLGTVKLSSNLSVHQSQVSIVHLDHFAIVTWLSTHIIMHWLKRSNLRKKNSNSRFNFLFSRKIQPSNLSWLHKEFSSPTTLKERPLGDRSSLTLESELKMFLEDLPMRQRLVKSLCLHLTFSSSSRLVIRQDFLEFLLLPIPEVMLLLFITLDVVVPLVVVVLVGVELLPLEVVGNEVSGVAALKAAPR